MRLKATIVFLSVLFSQFSQASEDVKVLASIKPLQLLAADIVGDTGDVELLIKPGASPHHYAMKPSDRRKLDSAHVVAWVGPDLETFLEKSLRGSDALVLQMADAEEGHENHDQHEGHGHEEHDDHDEHDDHKGHDDHAAHDDHTKHEDEHDEHHDEEAVADAHHDHEHAGDPHLWLDPMVSLAFGKELQEQLARRYPAHAETFAGNYKRLEQNILSLDAQLKESFKPLQSHGFFVFHDAWGHFVNHYGLNQLGYFTVDPGRKPGARHLTEIREQLEHEKAVCVFSEPQFKPSIIHAVTNGLDVRQGAIDPLATDTEVKQNSYTAYIRSVADQFIDCLTAR
ncbi:zinc ABC transporter substrate-binding protein ZnuA [Pontibacterium granulatum]|uniref:zinc ABC transporter substrate-binding protein ZnuA n=1 Tax=Pontibacterium granulatum TaxID=2036029 RepID=UPI00249C3D8C|nr:zinc ABC transporter substrate-binding protein ZnuA [Pontibacterium granulatum]MDI3324226.1 zinc ABC transporter substrate-binding protein ZnuA [Pontibacterium granulatum]